MKVLVAVLLCVATLSIGAKGSGNCTVQPFNQNFAIDLKVLIQFFYLENSIIHPQ